MCAFVLLVFPYPPKPACKGDIARKDRLVTVAMAARGEAQAAYQELKQNNVDLERRFRETQVQRKTPFLIASRLFAPAKVA